MKAQTKQARELIARIESALARLQVMALQERPLTATVEDITTLSHVVDKLEGTEDAWTNARIMADSVRDLADAQADALDVGLQ